MEKIKGLLSSKSAASTEPSKTVGPVAAPRAGPPTARLLVIGAGSRGSSFARHVFEKTEARVTSVAEPIASKRRDLGAKWIWPDGERHEDQEFDSYQDFVQYEQTRREREQAGETVLPGVDGVFICTLDNMHCEIVEALAPFNLHVMCEKPLATTLEDCLRIRHALQPAEGEQQKSIFSIGHVLRYTPQNTLLRKLVLEDRVIGDVLSVEHTEPVGYWHFSHSYVRGNWRKESYTAPSLLTKSCHDIDWLLWMFSSPLNSREAPHLPKSVSATGSLTYFRKARKPKGAGAVTNCLACPVETECIYSAKRIYLDQHLKAKNTQWPVKIVNPDIEDCLKTHGPAAAETMLLKSLAEDYTAATPEAEVEARPWFGRCVWEADNDVCDDQTVTITWDDEPPVGGWAKSATLHMVAWSREICARRGRMYGSLGEVAYDSSTITVFDFASGQKITHSHHDWAAGGHGGGDAGLTAQFVKAIEAVKAATMSVEAAQAAFIGCTVEDAFRSHAMVFAAEDARHAGRTLDWADWWHDQVERSRAANGKGG